MFRPKRVPQKQERLASGGWRVRMVRDGLEMRKEGEYLGDVWMILSMCRDNNLTGALQKGQTVRRPALSFEHYSKIGKRGRQVRMVRAKDFLLEGQGAAQERFGFGVLALALKGEGELVE